MASLKYFLLCPFVFLCLTCTFANRVLNSHDGSSFGFGPDVGVGPRAGGGSAGKGVDPIVDGVGVGYRPGFGPGGFGPGGFGPGGFGPGVIGPRPGIGGYGDDCMMGYVCRARECNGFVCKSYSFHPMTTSMDLSHDVKINWAKSKPFATAQHGESERQPTEKAQNGV